MKINKVGKHIDKKFAHKYYDEISVGIDFTARDVQRQLKEKGLPWEKAKAFDFSAPLGKKFVKISDLPDPKSIKFEMKKNGETVQLGDSSLMLFPFDQLISEVSKYFTLKMGDLIFTGTPKGVGPVEKGDVLEGFLEDERLINLKVK